MSVIEAAGASHIGQRSHNEDAWQLDGDLQLILVADGVGGHEAGDVASALTCDVIAREVLGGTTLEQAIHSANSEVMSAVERGDGRENMATTIVAARFEGPDYELAWVGDSRAYLWDGQLKLLSQDHSHVQELFARGQLTVEQAHTHPRKNVILQAIGMQSATALSVDSNSGRLAEGELLLLCSDGLSDVVDSAALCTILGEHAQQRNLQATVDALVATAVNAGGRDNITAVLIAGKEGAPPPPGEQAHCVWRFDPSTGEYLGLPEPAPGSAPETRSPIHTTEGGPIAPRSKDETVSMPPQRASGDEHSEPHVHFRGRRLALWLMLGAAIVLGVFYSLGLEGTG